MVSILKACLVISVIGLSATLLINVGAWLGITAPDWLVAAVAIGAFPLGVAVALLQLQVRRNEGDWVTAGWGSLFLGISGWLRLACAAAIINLIFAMQSEIAVVTSSAVSLCLYVIFGAILYSAYGRPWLVSPISCPNGHAIKYFNRFCPTCGALNAKLKRGS